MAGSGLGLGLSIKGVILATIIGLVILSWLGDPINAYIGAKTGLPGAVIARQSFGTLQARIVASLVMVMLHTGWWAINTTLVANAFCTAFGIDYTKKFFALGYNDSNTGDNFHNTCTSRIFINEMDGLYSCSSRAANLYNGYLSFNKTHGMAGIVNWAPKQTMPMSVAVSTVVGTCVCQWAMIADYSRMHRPTWRDSLLMPSLLIAVGVVEIILRCNNGYWSGNV